MTTAASVEERSALADAVRRLLERHPGPRGFLADGDRTATVDPGLWTALAVDMGVTSLLVPASCGGAGATYGDLVVVVELLGRSLAPVPVLTTAGMATGLLLADGGPVAETLLSRMAQEDTAATVAWPDIGGPVSARQAPTVTADPSVATLTGTASFVLDGAEADLLLVPAATPDGLVVLAVEGDAPGMLRRSLTTLDITRGMAEVVFDRTPATLVCDAATAQDTLSVASDLALAVLAAEQVGVAQRCLDAAVEWCMQRVQFERPIGSFQAVKHQLVDLLLQVELARSAMEEAIAAADRYLADRGPQTARSLRIAAAMAKAVCSDAAVTVARQSLHLFGGTGFTWEHDAHLYFRRAVADSLLLGDAAQHRTRLAAAVGV